MRYILFSVTIRRILPDIMNNTEEEEIPSSSIVYNQDDLLGVGDPLSDPLALDDNLDNADYGSATDADTSADGEIILVDVNSLKSAFVSTSSPETDHQYHQCEEVVVTTTSAASSPQHESIDSNGIKFEQCEDNLVSKHSASASTTSNTQTNSDNEQNDSVVLNNLLGDSLLDIVDISDIATAQRNITASSIDIASGSGSGSSHLNIHFEPVNITLVDEVNEEGEGARSDGSDSGFGLELSSTIIPEKTVVSPVGE